MAQLLLFAGDSQEAPPATRAHFESALPLRAASEAATSLGERLLVRLRRQTLPRVAGLLAAQESTPARLRALEPLDALRERALGLILDLLVLACADARGLLTTPPGRLRPLAEWLTSHPAPESPPPDALPAAALLRNLRAAARESELDLLGELDASADTLGDDAQLWRVLRELLVDEAPAGARPVEFAALDPGLPGSLLEQAVELRLVRKDGAVSLESDSGLRKSAGAFFTPRFAVEHLLDEALEPALDAHLQRVRASSPQPGARARALLELRCGDIACGAGAFLLPALERIALRFGRFLDDVQDPQLEAALAAHLPEHPAPPLDAPRLRWLVARHCLYGVDLNATAVGLTRRLLWLSAGVAGLPAPAQSDHFRVGNALTGAATLPRSARTAPEDGLAELLDAELLARLGAEATASPAELLADLAPLHFPLAFPRVAAAGGFDCVLGNPPWEEATVEELAFWAQRCPGLRGRSNREQRREIARLRRAHPEGVAEYERRLARTRLQRRALTRGTFAGMSVGDPDLYKAFLWRFWELCRAGGRLGVVLPASVFATKGGAPWRQATLPRADTSLVLCRNDAQWLFACNPGYSCVLQAMHRVEPSAARLRLRGPVRSRAELAASKAEAPIELDLARLAANDPLLCVPRVGSRAGLALFERLLRHPAFGATDRTDFRALATTELHATNEGKKKGLFSGDPTEHPIYNHVNLGHFAFDPAAGAFSHGRLEELEAYLLAKRARCARTARSPFRAMPATWAGDPASLPCRNPRIALRDVVHASNPRKVWAALVPAGTILTNKAPYLLFPRGELHAQAYLLGILGSSLCDWFGHLRVNLNLNFFILNALPVPLADFSDPRCQRLARLAAGLACLGPGELGPWRELAPPVRAGERDAALAELDALASLLYGVPEEDLPLVWDRPTRPPLEQVQAFRRDAS